MAITMRGILLTAVPTLAALFGIFWFRRKKKSMPDSNNPDRGTRSDSVPRLILTQPSDEGLKVSEINVTEPQLSEIPETEEGGTTETGAPSQEEESQGTDAERPIDEEQVKAEIVGINNTSIKSSIGQNTDNDMNADVSTIDQGTQENSQSNGVQESTRPELASTDRVEELIEQSSISTISKTVVATKHLFKDSVQDSNGSSKAEDAGLHHETASEANKVEEVSQENGLVKDSEGNIVQEIDTAQTEVKTDMEVTSGALTRSRLPDDRKRKCSESLFMEESPSPELAASPVGNCSASTNGSETSGDSGIVATHPCKTSYQFNFPADLCGLLIGSRGKNIRRVMDQSGTVIVVNDKVYDRAHQLIIVEGSKNAVAKALEIMKTKFPKKKFPMIDWREAPPENPVLCSEIMQLHLPEGVHIDVIVSSVVALNHVFVQQPTHPTFPMIENQNTTMNMCYSQDGMVPQLPRPIEMGVICAAPMYNGWYRAQVVQSYPDVDEVDLRFVDYGGYCREPGSALRQIRSDFTTLPFQAVECYLANVIPPKGAENFPAEANAVLEQLVQGQVLQAEVVGQEDDGVPYVQLYILKNSRLFLVNRELVDRGVASWAESA